MALVAVSPAAAGSKWASLRPMQRLIQSCMLGVCAFVMAFYAVSGIAFGYVHFFTLEEFAEIGGFPAFALVVGSGALAWAWGAHLWERHVESASSTACAGARTAGYALWAGTWSVGLLAALFVAGRTSSWSGIAPSSDWMLAPLPWLWRAFIGFASDKMVMRMLAAGGILLAVMFLLAKLRIAPRIALAGTGVLVCGLGAWLLGDASYQYAAARGLRGLAQADMVKALATRPGSYNAWTFLCWWSGWACLAMGTLFAALGLFLPASALGRSAL